MIRAFARITAEKDGRVAIEKWFVDAHSNERLPDQSTQWISPGQSHDDVPFQTWSRHAGEVVDLSEWIGTGTGMIGGPARIELAAMLYDGPLRALTPWSNRSEVNDEVTRLEASLRDERYSYGPALKAQIEDLLENGHRWLELN